MYRVTRPYYTTMGTLQCVGIHMYFHLFRPQKEIEIVLVQNEEVIPDPICHSYTHLRFRPYLKDVKVFRLKQTITYIFLSQFSTDICSLKVYVLYFKYIHTK